MECGQRDGKIRRRGDKEETTMKTYYILSALGKDRPGIVADVSEVIYKCGGNIEDSSISLLLT